MHEMMVGQETRCRNWTPAQRAGWRSLSGKNFVVVSGHAIFPLDDCEAGGYFSKRGRKEGMMGKLYINILPHLYDVPHIFPLVLCSFARWFLF